MDLNLCIFASLVLVSVGAIRFDLGPQKFTDASSPIDTHASPKDGVVLYLTDDQIKALEASGAVVTPVDESVEFTEEIDDSEDTDYNDEHEEQDIEEEFHQDDSNSDEEKQVEESEVEVSGNVDLDDIFRILNEEHLLEEEEEKSQENVVHETHVINVEESREIPSRFLARQQLLDKKQREGKFIAPSEKKARSKIYSTIRYQQSQKSRLFSLPQVQEPTNSEEQNQKKTQQSTLAPVPKFRLVPYEVEEKPEEEQQDELEQLAPQEQEITGTNNLKKGALFSPLPTKLFKAINQHRYKLFQDELELQTALRELKQAPKYSDQKYATELEKLRANLEKQNNLAKVEALAKSAPQFIKKEIEKRHPVSAKQIKESTHNPEKTLLKPVTVSVAKPAPKLKTKKVEPEKPAEVKNESVPVKGNIYVKVNKPFLVEHVVPVEIRKEISHHPLSKNEKITILRHIWEH